MARPPPRPLTPDEEAAVIDSIADGLGNRGRLLFNGVPYVVTDVILDLPWSGRRVRSKDGQTKSTFGCGLCGRRFRVADAVVATCPPPGGGTMIHVTCAPTEDYEGAVKAARRAGRERKRYR